MTWNRDSKDQGSKGLVAARVVGPSLRQSLVTWQPLASYYQANWLKPLQLAS